VEAPSSEASNPPSFYIQYPGGVNSCILHPNVRALVNPQEVRGKAKPFQVEQSLALVEQHNLPIGGEE
jgi:hypothetical protein